jgi:3-hydroxyisobutyrate dehydrogenase-like beta-hydroxyacid dehydrogenase
LGHVGEVDGKRERAACAGGTAAEVVAEAEVLITMLPGTQELHDVMFSPAALGPASPT